MKLMDVIVTTSAQSTRDTGFPLEEGAATVVNKVPTSSPICDHCDIFAAPRGKRGAEIRADASESPSRNASGLGFLFAAHGPRQWKPVPKFEFKRQAR